MTYPKEGIRASGHNSTSLPIQQSKKTEDSFLEGVCKTLQRIWNYIFQSLSQLWNYFFENKSNLSNHNVKRNPTNNASATPQKVSESDPVASITSSSKTKVKKTKKEELKNLLKQVNDQIIKVNLLASNRIIATKGLEEISIDVENLSKNEIDSQIYKLKQLKDELQNRLQSISQKFEKLQKIHTTKVNEKTQDTSQLQKEKNLITETLLAQKKEIEDLEKLQSELTPTYLIKRQITELENEIKSDSSNSDFQKMQLKKLQDQLKAKEKTKLTSEKMIENAKEYQKLESTIQTKKDALEDTITQSKTKENMIYQIDRDFQQTENSLTDEMNTLAEDLKKLSELEQIKELSPKPKKHKDTGSNPVIQSSPNSKRLSKQNEIYTSNEIEKRDLIQLLNLKLSKHNLSKINLDNFKQISSQSLRQIEKKLKELESLKNNYEKILNKFNGEMDSKERLKLLIEQKVLLEEKINNASFHPNYLQKLQRKKSKIVQEIRQLHALINYPREHLKKLQDLEDLCANL